MNRFENKVNRVLDQLERIKIVPVLAIESVEDGLRVCEILQRCGLKTAEVTFRTAAAEEIIRQASNQYPDLVIGAGTILTVDDLHRAFNAGAQFAVAPGFNPTVVREAVANGYAFFPGVATPSEVEQAMELGCRMLKFFPAEASGGVPMLKSLIAPYKHLGIRFMPTGGLHAENIGSYLALPEVPCAGGTWIGNPHDIAGGHWDKVEALIRSAVTLASSL